MVTLDSLTATWRELMRQFSLPEARKAVAGEVLVHLGAVLVELGSSDEGKRVSDLGWAFLHEVAGGASAVAREPEEELLAEAASRCRCCSECHSQVPCAGVMQGASCDDRCVCDQQYAVDGS